MSLPQSYRFFLGIIACVLSARVEEEISSAGLFELRTNETEEQMPNERFWKSGHHYKVIDDNPVYMSADEYRRTHRKDVKQMEKDRLKPATATDAVKAGFRQVLPWGLGGKKPDQSGPLTGDDDIAREVEEDDDHWTCEIHRSPGEANHNFVFAALIHEGHVLISDLSKDANYIIFKQYMYDVQELTEDAEGGDNLDFKIRFAANTRKTKEGWTIHFDKLKRSETFREEWEGEADTFLGRRKVTLIHLKDLKEDEKSKFPSISTLKEHVPSQASSID